MSDQAAQMHPCIAKYKAKIGAGGIEVTGLTNAAGGLTTTGLSCSGALSALGGTTTTDLTAHGDVQLGDTAANTLTVLANAEFANDVSIGVDATDDLYVNATQHNTAAEFHEGAEEHIGTEIHDGAETHTGTETHSGNETHNGSMTMNGGGTLGNAPTDVWTLYGVMPPSLGARVVDGGYFLPDSNNTISTYYKYLYCTGISADRYVKIDFNGSYVGDSVEVRLKNSSTFELSVQNSSGIEIIGLNLTTVFSGVRLVWTGSAWEWFGMTA